MSDLIRREDVFKALGITDKSTKYGGDHSGYNTLMLYEIKGEIDSIPTTKPKEYVKDGTLTVQMPTIKEAKAIDKIVVYADTYRQEYYMPLPKVGKWKPYLPEYGDMFECSVCEEVTRLPYKPMRMPYNFCPNCGAKMERSE